MAVKKIPCPVCNRRIVEDSAFCPYCSSPIPMQSSDKSIQKAVNVEPELSKDTSPTDNITYKKEPEKKSVGKHEEEPVIEPVKETVVHEESNTTVHLDPETSSSEDYKKGESFENNQPEYEQNEPEDDDVDEESYEKEDSDYPEARLPEYSSIDISAPNLKINPKNGYYLSDGELNKILLEINEEIETLPKELVFKGILCFIGLIFLCLFLVWYITF